MPEACPDYAEQAKVRSYRTRQILDRELAAVREDPAPETPTGKWFVLRVAAGHEIQIAKYLESRRIEHYLPTYRLKRRYSHRAAQEIERALFPGYAFVRFSSAANRTFALQTPGVFDLLKFGRDAATLLQSEIELIQAMVASGDCFPVPPPPKHWTPGMPVRVTHGPLVGLEGQVIKEKKRLWVLVHFASFGSSTGAWVEPDRLEIIRQAAAA